MTSPSLDTGTWRRKSALATWTFTLPLPVDAQPAIALCNAAARAVVAVGEFAIVTTASWTTLSLGEDARVDHGAPLDPDRLRTVCEEVTDVTRVDLDLDLRCFAADGSEGIVERGAQLVVDLDWPDPKALGHGQPELYLVLHLDVDIHAPRTGSPNPDNHALAALNGPRLTSFLKRVRSELDATLVDMDAYAGSGAISEDGWAA